MTFTMPAVPMEYDLTVAQVRSRIKTTALIYFMVTRSLDDASNVKASKAQARALFADMGADQITNAAYDPDIDTLFIG